MKIRYILVAAATLALTACNDSFLERVPGTAITPPAFFQSVQDLETYTNGFYDYIGGSYDDLQSDNIGVHQENTTLSRLLKGGITPTEISSWYNNYGRIRNINFLLANYHRVNGAQADIDHYVGIARMFRALQYQTLVKTWCNVPFYNTPLQTDDREELYKTQDPRELVMDSVLNDLRFAATHIKEGTSRTRITKWAALGYLARVALHEGTFRKYHDELGLQSTADEWIRIARDAARDIMQNGGFSLEPNYTDLFLSEDLSKSPEIILFKDYDVDLNVRHNASSLFDYIHALSRELMNEYLYIENGVAKPFHQVPGYATKGRLEVFENRDPRMAQTFAPPFFIPRASRDTVRVKLQLGGYPQVKFYPLDSRHDGWNMAYNDLPMIRYAEILLIYAEACAELGELDQTVIDQTVNPIRRRAGVPELSFAEAMANPDPDLLQKYPNIAAPAVGAALEVRRERRIELACEGFRHDDVVRWKRGELFARPGQGIYLSGLGLLDMSGKAGHTRPADYVDTGLFHNKEHQLQWLAQNGYPADYVENNGITVYYLDNETFYLSEGDHGYIMVVSEKDGGKGTFIEPKYYYRPVNLNDRVVNKHLVETPFW